MTIAVAARKITSNIIGETGAVMKLPKYSSFAAAVPLPVANTVKYFRVLFKEFLKILLDVLGAD